MSQTDSKIYGVYTGTDMKSYMCLLKIADTAATVPVYQVTAPGGKGLPIDGSWQDYHRSTLFGSMTVVLDGELELGVTAGPIRTATAKAGDAFVMIDLLGDGHSAMRKGRVPLHVLNTRFALSVGGLWAALSKGFTGWPDNVLPPAEYSPYPSTGLADPSRRYPDKSP
ncbi:MAG: hypothetical protein KDE14_03050 [Rhodobacteraceae bacterium]|nr:hypothetical protein [Paracoccaceae bacterium]